MKKLFLLIFVGLFLISFASLGSALWNGVDFGGNYVANNTVLWDNFNRSNSGAIGNSHIPATAWSEFEDANGKCGIYNEVANCSLSGIDNTLGRIEHTWNNTGLYGTDYFVFQMNISLQDTDDEWNFIVYEIDKSIVRGKFLANGTFAYASGAEVAFTNTEGSIVDNNWYIFKAEFNRTSNLTNYY